MKIAGYEGGIGVLGPGLDNWPDTAAVLSARRAYQPAPTVLPVPALLPPTERRRTGRVVKTALAVALEATKQAAIEPATLASVFASSGADGHNCHELCRALALEAREISPTRFANSVHNAAAGYWSIATGAKRASTVVCAFDASFCAGLLEALTQVAVDPLRSKRPIPDAFGAALVLTPHREAGSLARIEASLGSGPCDSLPDAQLESLRAAMPAARCLPLLRQLAMHTQGRTVLEYLDGSNTLVEVEPCN
jgi:hypothetical protein